MQVIVLSLLLSNIYLYAVTKESAPKSNSKETLTGQQIKLFLSEVSQMWWWGSSNPWNMKHGKTSKALLLIWYLDVDNVLIILAIWKRACPFHLPYADFGAATSMLLVMETGTAGALQLLLWAGLKGKQFFIKHENWEVGPFFALPFRAKSEMKRKYHITLQYRKRSWSHVSDSALIFQFFQLCRWRDKPCEVAMGSCQMPQRELWMWASSFPSHCVVVCRCPVLSSL